MDSFVNPKYLKPKNKTVFTDFYGGEGVDMTNKNGIMKQMDNIKTTKEVIGILSSLMFIVLMVALIFLICVQVHNIRAKTKILKCGLQAGITKLVL